MTLAAASERVNAEEAAHLCSVAVGKENVSGEALFFLINTTK